MITVSNTPGQPSTSPPTVTATNYVSKVVSVNGVNCTITPYIAVAAGFAAETVTGTPQPILVAFSQNVADFSISIVNNTAPGSYIVGYDSAGNQIAVSEAAYSSTASSTLRVTVSAPAGSALGAVRLFAGIVGVAWTNISLTPTPATTTVVNSPVPGPTTILPPATTATPQTPPATAQTPNQSAPVSPTVSQPAPASSTTTQTSVPTTPGAAATTVPVVQPQLFVVASPTAGGPVPSTTTPQPTTTTPSTPVTTQPSPQPTVSTGPNTTSQYSQSLSIGLDTIVQISTQELAYVYILNSMTQLPTGSFTLENISNYIDLNVSIAAAPGVIFTPSQFVLPNLQTQDVTVSYDMTQINQLQAGLNDLSSIITLTSNNVNTSVTPVVNTPNQPVTPPAVSVATNNWLEQRFQGSPGKYGKMPESAIFAQQPFLTQVVSKISYSGANQINAPTTVRWTSTWDFGANPAPWIFAFTTDDGMRCYVDDVLILNGWIEQSATPYATTATYSGLHTVRVEYFNDVAQGTAIFSITPQAQVAASSPVTVSPGTSPLPSNNQVVPGTGVTIPHPAVIGNTAANPNL